MSVYQYFDGCPSCFDARRFSRGLRLSGHSLNVCVGSQVQLTCAEGWLKCWLHWDALVWPFRGLSCLALTAPSSECIEKCITNVNYLLWFTVISTVWAPAVLTSSSLAQHELLHIDCVLIDCWLVYFLFVWLEQLCFEVRLRQVLTVFSARV